MLLQTFKNQTDFLNVDNEKFYIAQKESADLWGIYFLRFAQITWQKKVLLLLQLDALRQSPSLA